MATTRLSGRAVALKRLTAAPYYQGTSYARHCKYCDLIFFILGTLECKTSPYSENNPDGFINLRLAETTLMEVIECV